MAEILDLKDRKILFELELNSRASFAEVGKKVGLSKQVVKFRVERLIKKGIIRYFYCDLNQAKGGMNQFNIYLRFKKQNIKREQEFIQKMIDDKRVCWLPSCDGRWDMIAGVLFKNIHEFNIYQKQLMFEYEDIIKSKAITVVTALIHFPRFYLIDKRPGKYVHSTITEYSAPLELDALDKKIYNLIAVNARMPIIDIAKKAGVSPEVARYRLKGLVKGGLIQSFSLKLDYSKYGYYYYKIMLDLQDLTPKRKKELVEFCGFHPNVIFVVEVLGMHDFQIDIEAKGDEGMRQFINEFREKFSDIIADFEVLSISKELKEAYFLR